MAEKEKKRIMKEGGKVATHSRGGGRFPIPASENPKAVTPKQVKEFTEFTKAQRFKRKVSQ